MGMYISVINTKLDSSSLHHPVGIVRPTSTTMSNTSSTTMSAVVVDEGISKKGGKLNYNVTSPHSRGDSAVVTFVLSPLKLDERVPSIILVLNIFETSTTAIEAVEDAYATPRNVVGILYSSCIATRVVAASCLVFVSLLVRLPRI